MNRSIHSLPLPFILACFLMLSILLGAAPAPQTPPADASPAIPTLFIAGDSTSASNSPTAMGWGIHFQDFFDPAQVKIVNGGKSGLSSRTFINGGSWDAIISRVQPNDSGIIQFGHNDNGPVDSFRFRGTKASLGEETEEAHNAQGMPETVHTFGWYMRKMINDVKAKNANPIVVSMTVRGEWKDGKVERGFGDYAHLAGELANAEGVRYIDLNNMAADRYDQMGQAAVKPFFPRDTTHNSPEGATLNAQFIISGIKALHENALIRGFTAAGRAVEVGPAKYALPPKLAVSRGAARDVFERWLNSQQVADPALPSIFLIGDSTVRNGRGDGVDRQWGWGDPLSVYFDPAKVNLVNRAVGGTTARSFYDGRWAPVKEMLKAGDYVLMQFGTNSENQASFTENINKFIADCRAKNVTPIVCTLIPRNSWNNGKMARNPQPAVWARTVAQEQKVQLLDLNNLIADQYDVIGKDATTALFESGPHTNAKGAEFTAQIIATAVKSFPETPFTKYLREKPAANW